MARFDSYFLCTAPRSGSTMLCKLLTACGAGHPASYFHRPDLDDWCQGLSLPHATELHAIFAAARAQGRGDTALSGIRLQRHSAAFFTRQLAALHPDIPDDAGRIAATFGRTAYLHLTRADKLAQAVSLIRAEQSGLWHRNADGSDLERTGPAQDARYDRTAIALQMDTLTQYDRDWTAWFDAHGITPLHIDYDALTRDPTGTVHRILTALGLPTAPALNITPLTARLSDHVNADWIARFRAGSR